MASAYHSAMGHGVGDLSMGETDENREPLSPWTVLKQVAGPDPPIGERLLSARQVFRAVGGQEKRCSSTPS
eukprot:12408338-Karenia_brevis.AAC.1